ncbi:hypothetical protein IJI31_06970 [bacterium]|nr:hypothetical protein [bacterium]
MTTAIDTIGEITQALKDLYEYVLNTENLKSDFDEYLATIGAKDVPLNRMESVFIPYAFERYIDEYKKTIVELFNDEKNNTISNEFLNAQYSIYKVKRLMKDGFELYNLVNEKTYRVKTLMKMTSLRGIGIGQYIVARFFKHFDEYYLIEITNVLSSTQEKDAVRYAIMKAVQNPRLVYADNPEKEQTIQDDIKTMYKKFVNVFGTDTIMTTNEYADDIIGEFNSLTDEEKVDISDKIATPETYEFFKIKELNNDYNNFLENSMKGFSSHDERYDVGIIFDEDYGLYAIPFYQTFCKIFEDKNIVKNAKECIEYFLNSASISDKILERVSYKYSNFVDVINEVLGTNYTMESLLNEYKSDYLKYKIYSPTSVLFCADVFEKSLSDALFETEENE